MENRWAMRKAEQHQAESFPSHGRGRRFNPYSAHQPLLLRSYGWQANACTLVRSSEGCPSKPAVSHARRGRSMQASGEKPRWTSAVSGRWTRSDVAREELPHQAHCRAAAVERAHLHEAVRYSFHHV